MGNKKAQLDKENIEPVSEAELPPEFKKFDKPLGLEQHVFNIIVFGIITNGCAVYTFLYLLPYSDVPKMAFVVCFTYGYFTLFGLSVGAHRYWTHRTFKANKPLQYLLMLLQAAAFQYPIFKWCKDHRLHHKYSDTDADPHNPSRGLWYSHMGWLFVPKHVEVIEKLKQIDISDLAKDPVVRFQSKYYWELVFISCFLIPMGIMHYLFPTMTFSQTIAINFARHAISSHVTFLLNSIAHKYGDRPYDKYIAPTDNKFVNIFTVGEGWHNYHHTFPWDHNATELGYGLNLSTLFIHFFAMIGWAWDLKTVSHKLLVDRINRTGDGNHPLHQHNKDAGELDGGKIQRVGTEPAVSSWGWGDKLIKSEDVEITESLFSSKIRQK